MANEADEADPAADWRAALRTLRTECRDCRLPVEGSLPAWLSGTLLRNGPGQFEVGGRSLRHWFDPLALLRRFRIEGDAPDGGRVSYANRFVRSRDFRWARDRGRVRTMFPGTPPDRPVGVRLRQALGGEFPDNPIVGVRRLGDDHLAVTEAPAGFRVDPRTLATRDPVALGHEDGPVLAHLHGVPDAGSDGLHYELGVSYGRSTAFTLLARPDRTPAPAAPDPEPVATLSFDDPPYVHSFVLTERYAVIPEPTVGLDAGALLTGALRRETFLDAVVRREGPARFHVVDRRTGDVVARPAADPFFVYHHANAFETGDGEVVVDLVAYPDERAITGLTLANLRADEPDLPVGSLVRYRLPLSGGRATRRPLRDADAGVEFPAIHYRRYNAREHRYVYAAETTAGAGLPTGLVKVDAGRGEVAAWRPDGGHPSEPVFVPAPDPAGEDDGVCLSVTALPARERSELVCLDAADLSVRARAPLPHLLPYGFHGQFYGPTDPGRSVA
jgi:carotenoid cleavage dioxygenase-like enzyme